MTGAGSASAASAGRPPLRPAMKSRMADFGHRRRRPSPMGSGRLRSRTRRQTVASETPRIFAQSLTLRRRFSSFITVSLFSKRKRPGIPAKGSGPCLPTASVWTRWRIMLRPDAPPQASGHEKGPGGSIRAGPDFVSPRRAEGPRCAILEYQVEADMGGYLFSGQQPSEPFANPQDTTRPLRQGMRAAPFFEGHSVTLARPSKARTDATASFFRCANCAIRRAPSPRGAPVRNAKRPQPIGSPRLHQSGPFSGVRTVRIMPHQASEERASGNTNARGWPGRDGEGASVGWRPLGARLDDQLGDGFHPEFYSRQQPSEDFRASQTGAHPPPHTRTPEAWGPRAHVWIIELRQIWGVYLFSGQQPSRPVRTDQAAVAGRPGRLPPPLPRAIPVKDRSSLATTPGPTLPA